jgi:hypothetical protein
MAASDQQLAGSADNTDTSGSGDLGRSWRGQNCDPPSTVAMGRAQFTAELIFPIFKLPPNFEIQN